MLNDQKSLAALCFLLLSTLFQQEVRFISLWFQGGFGARLGGQMKKFSRLANARHDPPRPCTNQLIFTLSPTLKLARTTDINWNKMCNNSILNVFEMFFDCFTLSENMQIVSARLIQPETRKRWRRRWGIRTAFSLIDSPFIGHAYIGIVSAFCFRRARRCWFPFSVVWALSTCKFEFLMVVFSVRAARMHAWDDRITLLRPTHVQDVSVYGAAVARVGLGFHRRRTAVHGLTAWLGRRPAIAVSCWGRPGWWWWWWWWWWRHLNDSRQTAERQRSQKNMSSRLKKYYIIVLHRSTGVANWQNIKLT